MSQTANQLGNSNGDRKTESPLVEGEDYYLEGEKFSLHFAVPPETRLLLRERLPSLPLRVRARKKNSWLTQWVRRGALLLKNESGCKVFRLVGACASLTEPDLAT